MDQEGTLLAKSGAIAEARDFTLSDGRRMHYRVLGNGPVLLLIHGLKMGLGQWHAVLAPLAKNHTVYAIDCLGSGGSSRVDLTRLSIEDDLLSPLAQFMRDVIASPVALIGHSLGAFAALRLRTLMPNVVRGVIAVAPVGFVSYTPSRFKVLGSRFFMNALTATAMRVTEKNMGDFLTSVMADPTQLDPAFTDYFVASLKQNPPSHPFQLIHRLVTMRGMRDEFLLIQEKIPPPIPVLIVSGDKDPLIPSARLRAALPNDPSFSFVGVPDSGHVPFVERPVEFLRITNDFLRSLTLS